MLVFNASPFLGAFNQLGTLSQLLNVLQNKPSSMRRENFNEVQGALLKIDAECNALGLTMCAVSTKRAITQFDLVATTNPPNSQLLNIPPLYSIPLLGALQQLVGRLQDEIAERMLLVVPPEQVPFYEQTAPLFGADFIAKFPSAQFDLSEAGKCMALGRSTAAVFHLMRIMETGLGAVHRCLGIAKPLVGNDRNWGNVLGRIRDNIASRSKWPEKDAFQEIYAMMNAVKDAWRNATMHIENKYTEEEARQIFDTVKGLMTKLASRMDEQGLPLA